MLSRKLFAIPYALFLLSFIGGKMLIDGVKNKEEDCESKAELTFRVLLVQAFATSIDALSVGFTISNYSLIYLYQDELMDSSFVLGVIT